MDEKERLYFRVPPLARRYDVAPSVIYDGIKRGAIRALKLGKSLRVPADEVARIDKEGISPAE